jgi:hypothetical protein
MMPSKDLSVSRRPPALRDHLFDRLRERQITAEDFTS